MTDMTDNPDAEDAPVTAHDTTASTVEVVEPDLVVDATAEHAAADTETDVAEAADGLGWGGDDEEIVPVESA